MPDNNSSTQKIEVLSSEVFDLDSIPNVEDARAELAARGVDTSKLKNKVSDLQKKAAAKAILAQAKEMRKSHLSTIKKTTTGAHQKVDDLREWLRDKLSDLNPSDRAQVYCRDFEHTPEEDLLELKEDILELEANSTKQNKNESDQD